MGIALTLFLPLALAVMMFSLGIGLTLDDFARVARQPRAFAVGAISQVVVIPAVAFVLCRLFSFPPDIAVGMMILSLCPGGVTSNMMTRYARGDLALSISLTGVTSLAALLTMPVLVVTFVRYFKGLDAPEVDVTALGLSMFAIIAIPVAAGMAIRRWAPASASAIEGFVTKLSFVLFVVVVAGALFANWDMFIANLPALGPGVVLMNVVLVAIGLGLSALASLGRGQATAIAIDTGMQNAALGITVGALVAGMGEGISAYSIPSGVYGVTMYFVALPFVMWRRRMVN